MPSYCIAYELKAARTNPDAIAAALSQIGATPIFPTLWIAQTGLTVQQIRERVRGPLSPDDQLLVLELGPSWTHAHLGPDLARWLGDHLA
jgi:hypothetical protein